MTDCVNNNDVQKHTFQQKAQICKKLCFFSDIPVALLVFQLLCCYCKSHNLMSCFTQPYVLQNQGTGFHDVFSSLSNVYPAITKNPAPCAPLSWFHQKKEEYCSSAREARVHALLSLCFSFSCALFQISLPRNRDVVLFSIRFSDMNYRRRLVEKHEQFQKITIICLLLRTLDTKGKSRSKNNCLLWGSGTF